MNAGYYPQGRISSGGGVAIPQPYAVSTMPPDPLFEQMTASPGMGHVWIDGSWHWNGYEWVWVSGRWEQDQAEHVYVQPYYDYSGDTYIYTPGYWSSRDRLPRGSIVRDHRDGRPSVVAPRPRPPRPPVAQPRDPYRPMPSGPSRYPGNIGPGNSGPITAPRPSYDPDRGGTYRPGPGRNRYRPPAPTAPPQNDGGYRPPPPPPPPRGEVGGMPSTPIGGGPGPVPSGGYQPPPPVYNPTNRGPAPQSRPGPYNPPPQQPSAPPARPAPQQGAPSRTAPPPPPPPRTTPPPPNTTTPTRGRR